MNRVRAGYAGSISGVISVYTGVEWNDGGRIGKRRQRELHTSRAAGYQRRRQCKRGYEFSECVFGNAGNCNRKSCILLSNISHGNKMFCMDWLRFNRLELPHEYVISCGSFTFGAVARSNQ